VGSIADQFSANSNLGQLSHVKELSETWLELWVVAKALAVIANLIFGRRAPDPAQDELSVSVYGI
jgi:hypothetical protein